MLKIKVCGMRDPENIRIISGMSPDFMGFIFYPCSKRYIGNDPDRLLFSQIPEEIIKTGVFVDENAENIMKKVRKFRLDAIQLHGSETPDLCSHLKSCGITIIKAFGLSNDSDFSMLIPFQDSCDYFLFDTKTGSHGGSGIKFDWSRMDDYKIDKPFFLSGGIGAEDIQSIKAVGNSMFYAVDINSRFESSPGIKDTEKIRAFIKEFKNQGI